MIQPGSRVMVFDWTLYVNDKRTPLSVTLKPATVVCRYGYTSPLNPRWKYPDVVDVEFDHRPGISKAHFTEYVTEINK